MAVTKRALMLKVKCHWELLRRHLPPDDLLFQDGDIYCRLFEKCLPHIDVDSTKVSREAEFTCGIASCCQTFDTLLKYETHYNSSHRHVCQKCLKTLPSSHLLDVHILETHDAMFSLLSEKQDMFQCLLADCPVKFGTSRDRKNHMIKIHKYPRNNRYDKSTNPASKSQTIPCKDHLESNNESMMKGTEEDMDTNISLPASCKGINTDLQLMNRTFSHKVPEHISFGHGISRGFMNCRGRGRKQQQKHQHRDTQECTMKLY